MAVAKSFAVGLMNRKNEIWELGVRWLSVSKPALVQENLVANLLSLPVGGRVGTTP